MCFERSLRSEQSLAMPYRQERVDSFALGLRKRGGRSWTLEGNRPEKELAFQRRLLVGVSSRNSKRYDTVSQKVRASLNRALMSTSEQSLSVQTARTWSAESEP